MIPSNKLTFGLDIGPKKQTVIPIVVKPYGIIPGFVFVTETEINLGDTLTFNNGVQFVAESVTHPRINADGGGTLSHLQGNPVTEYYAIVFNDVDTRKVTPWMGLNGFVSAQDNMFTSHILMPSSGNVERTTLGPLVTALVLGMDVPRPGPAATPPDAEDSTLFWAAQVYKYNLVNECPFLDFDWTLQFKTEPNKDDAGFVDTLFINVTSVPEGFKAFLVNNPGTLSGNNQFYDTIRIVCVDPQVAVGDHLFEFEVVNEHGSVPVILTLTVVEG